MLKLYDKVGTRDEVPCSLEAATLPDGVVWLDLLDPTREEIDFTERFMRVRLPSDEEVGDLQTFNRLRFDGEVIQVFAPVVFRDTEKILRTTNVGFILNAALLVTIRTETLSSFADYVSRAVAPGDQTVHAPIDVFLGLLETIADRLTDGMELVGSTLDEVSRRIFDPEFQRGGTRKKSKRYEAELEDVLRSIGRSGDLTSNIRDSLLGLGRMLAFVVSNAPDKLANGAKQRLKVLRQDIASLNDYETRLTDKVQFLLDSTLGFISIDQNRSFKVLTIFSVLGIPPTFVVGLYGMNFKNMPELDWHYGYEFGLAMVALSIIVPAVWLRVRGWT